MQTDSYRIDLGRWTLSRLSKSHGIELEPDPMLFCPTDNIENENENEGEAEVADRAEHFRQLLRSGEVKNRAELARRFGISRARVTQILGPAKQPEFKRGRNE